VKEKLGLFSGIVRVN